MVTFSYGFRKWHHWVLFGVGITAYFTRIWLLTECELGYFHISIGRIKRYLISPTILAVIKSFLTRKGDHFSSSWLAGQMGQLAPCSVWNSSLLQRAKWNSTLADWWLMGKTGTVSDNALIIEILPERMVHRSGFLSGHANLFMYMYQPKSPDSDRGSRLVGQVLLFTGCSLWSPSGVWSEC